MKNKKTTMSLGCCRFLQLSNKKKKKMMITIRSLLLSSRAFENNELKLKLLEQGWARVLPTWVGVGDGTLGRRQW